jgi:alginate O-acetyltransferase complex protein AlgI
LSFTSVEYLFFLISACAVLQALRTSTRPAGILVLSCVYYATWDVRAFFPLLAVAAVAYLTGLQLESTNGASARKIVGYGSVAALIASLLLLKVLPPSARPLQWIAPLGVSYYTFKLVSYVLDVLWGKQSAERNPVAFASYALFFPQIIAGPIQRSGDYFSRLRKPKTFSSALFYRASGRIALGLVKKLLIADRLAVLLNGVYSDVHSFAGGPLLITFYLFPILLYMDFSGLTDIAIGSALLLGIESPENFNYPFAATNVSEYWRRWHMSLTNWTGDYVFAPLRMATRNWGQAGLVFSICANMLSVALWHGIRWNFFAFGVFHSVVVSIEALTARARKGFLRSHSSWKQWAGVLGFLLTFHLVAAGLVFWRAPAVSDAFWVLTRMFVGLNIITPAASDFLAFGPWRTLLFGVCAFSLFAAGSELWKRTKPFDDFAMAPRWFRWSTQSVFVFILVTGLLLMFVSGSVKQPFLYEVF